LPELALIEMLRQRSGSDKRGEYAYVTRAGS
jgi:hypothetical protein